MVNCSIGHGILVSSWNRVRNPHDCMINCSMGPGDFDWNAKGHFADCMITITPLDM